MALRAMKRGAKRGFRAMVPLLLVALLACGGESFVPPQDCGGFGCVA